MFDKDHSSLSISRQSKLLSVSRRMNEELKASGFKVGRKAIQNYFKILRVSAIYPEIKTTMPNKAHKKYPYLLRDVVVTHKNQVWSTDITYIRVGGSLWNFIKDLLNILSPTTRKDYIRA